MLEMFCLLRNILPSLIELNKMLQTGSPNFLRVSQAINRCKSKFLEVAKCWVILKYATTHNHPQPPKNYSKKPRLVTDSDVTPL